MSVSLQIITASPSDDGCEGCLKKDVCHLRHVLLEAVERADRLATDDSIHPAQTGWGTVVLNCFGYLGETS